MNQFYLAHWQETTGNDLTDSWGFSKFYLELDSGGYAIRQIVFYDNGNQLNYDRNKLEDQFGGLAEGVVDLMAFPGEVSEISREEFEQQWAKKSVN